MVYMVEYEESGSRATITTPSFKLYKNSKGYNWEIKTVGNTIEECMDLAKKADDKAKEEWGEE